MLWGMDGLKQPNFKKKLPFVNLSVLLALHVQKQVK